MTSLAPEAIADLLDKHASALVLYARQWTRSPEDAVQEAFVRLARQPALPSHPVAWLFRVVRNLALDAAREEQRRRRHEATASGRLESWFVPSADARLDGAAAVAALEGLPAEQREIVVAHLWGGLSFAEVAGLMGTSASTAHRQYVQGLKAMRARFLPGNFEPVAEPSDKRARV